MEGTDPLVGESGKARESWAAFGCWKVTQNSGCLLIGHTRFTVFTASTVVPVLFSEHQPCPFLSPGSSIFHTAGRGASRRTAPPGDGKAYLALGTAFGFALRGGARQPRSLPRALLQEQFPPAH